MRALWQQHLPRLNGHFVPIDATHESIVAEPVAAVIAHGIRYVARPLGESARREPAPA